VFFGPNPTTDFVWRPEVINDVGQPFSLTEACNWLMCFFTIYVQRTHSIFTYSAYEITTVLNDHSIICSDSLSLHARYLFLAHLLNGMCAGGKGERCLPLQKYSMPFIHHEMSQIIYQAVQGQKIDYIKLYNMSIAVGLHVNMGCSLNDLNKAFFHHPDPLPLWMPFHTFLQSLDKLSRVNLYHIAANHSINNYDTIPVMCVALLCHLITGLCHPGSIRDNQYLCNVVFKYIAALINI
jgi:hypothetical protein